MSTETAEATVQTSGQEKAANGEKPAAEKKPAFRRGEPLSGARSPNGERPGNITLRELTSQLLRPAGDVPEGKAAKAKTEKPEQERAEEPETETPSRELTEPEPGTEGDHETHETHETETEETQEGEETEERKGAKEQSREEEEPEQSTEENEGNEANEEGRKAELPEEVKEAIEIAKAQDGGKGKAKLLKRVHTLVDERDTHRNARLAAEEQIHQLRGELQEARGRTGQPVEAGSATHPEVQKVQAEIAQVDGWLNWLEENPEGGAVTDAQGKPYEVPAAKVGRMRRELEQFRSEAVARKVATEQQVKAVHESAYQEVHRRAVSEFPWLKDKNSAEHQELQQIVAALPMLKQFPDYEMVIGYYFNGRKAAAEAAKAKANGAGKPLAKKVAATREPTRVVTEAPARGAGSRTGQGGKSQEAEEAKEAFQKTGSVRALGQMFAAKSRANRAK